MTVDERPWITAEEVEAIRLGAAGLAFALDNDLKVGDTCTIRKVKRDDGSIGWRVIILTEEWGGQHEASDLGDALLMAIADYT